MGELDLTELGEEYLGHARRHTAPELRVMYLSMAAGYRKLARFHELIRPLVETHECRDRWRCQQAIPHLSPPGEQQARIDAVPRSHLGHAHTSLLRLRDNPQLLFDRPTSPTLASRDDLDRAAAH
jgi:hypothetical protein